MAYSRDEMATFSLQKLSSIYPENLEQEDILKEVFDKRASVSNYFTLTSLVDVKHKWQEDVLQKYIDVKRETMPPEHPVSLRPEDEAKLDSAVITKETELEMQAKLDKGNNKQKERAAGTPEDPLTREEAVEILGEEKVEEIEKTAETVSSQEEAETIEETTLEGGGTVTPEGEIVSDEPTVVETKRLCSACKQEGHTKRTCPNK